MKIFLHEILKHIILEQMHYQETQAKKRNSPESVDKRHTL